MSVAENCIRVPVPVSGSLHVWRLTDCIIVPVSRVNAETTLDFTIASLVKSRPAGKTPPFT
ncbi:MAG: hypothetical protein M0Q91_16925 [Methanoregula sp.]|nr:hypothetical protein [Methanoregula sp.]